MWANENWSKRWDGGNAEIILKQDLTEKDFERVCNFLWAARSRLIDVGGDSVTK